LPNLAMLDTRPMDSIAPERRALGPADLAGITDYLVDLSHVP
jgi:hypothetical protein